MHRNARRFAYQSVHHRSVSHFEQPRPDGFADDKLGRASVEQESFQPVGNSRSGHGGNLSTQLGGKSKHGRDTLMLVRTKLARARRFDMHRCPWRMQRVRNPLGRPHKAG